jgi:hypothetical protein
MAPNVLALMVVYILVFLKTTVLSETTSRYLIERWGALKAIDYFAVS